MCEEFCSKIWIFIVTGIVINGKSSLGFKFIIYLISRQICFVTQGHSSVEITGLRQLYHSGIGHISRL